MSWKPSRWAAALLSCFFAPLGMLYVNRAGWALFYFLGLLCLMWASVWLFVTGHDFEWLAALVLLAVPHAWYIAARSPSLVVKPWIARWYSLAGVSLLVVAAITGVRAFGYEPFRAPSGSMFPSMPKGTQFLAKKWGYGNYAAYGLRLWRSEVSAPLARGHIYVFEYPVERRYFYLKRLIGLPGDRVVYKDKRLTVNGRAYTYTPAGSAQGLQLMQEEGYRIAIDPRRDATDLDVTVPPGQLFFLGDNRDNSLDSRYWGGAPLDHLVGEAVWIFGRDSAGP